MLVLPSNRESNNSNVKKILTEKIMESKLNFRKKKLFTNISEKRLHKTQTEEATPHLIPISNIEKDINESKHSLIQLIDTYEEEVLLRGLIKIRNLISVNNPPIKEVFTPSLAIKLISIIDKYSNNQEILLETLWIITNFMYSDSLYTKVFYENDLISRLTFLIRNDPLISYTIIDQLSWLIGNFAIDGIEYKQAFYNNKFLEFFIQALEDWNIFISIKENILRGIANIIQGISLPSQSKIKYKLIQHMQSIIRNIVIFDEKHLSNNKFKYLKYSIQIIFYLSNNQEEILIMLLQNDFFKYLLAILKETKDDSLLIMIIYFLDNLSALKNDSFITKLMQLNLLNILSVVLRKKCFVNSNLVKFICQFLTNLGNISTDYLNNIIKSDDLLYILFTFAKDSKYEMEQMHFNAFEVISTLLNTDTKKYITVLIKKGVIDLIIKYSIQKNNQVELFALNGLYNLLEYLSDNVTKTKYLIIRLDNSGLSDKLRNNMIKSPNQLIANISEQIIYSFYPNNDNQSNRTFASSSIEESNDSIYDDST